MGKHETGYERVDKDQYPTPAWVTEALVEHVEVAGKKIWEPAAGHGDMVEALRAARAKVFASDVADYGYPRQQRVFDFTAQMPDWPRPDAIVSNPPYGERHALAVQFIELGLERIGNGGFVAMLLPDNFDCAAGRRHLFKDCRDEDRFDQAHHLV
jgi:23S rRNA G2445 N2-methylase RlmL